MTAFRLIPYAAHGAIELASGLLLLVAPFVLGFTATGVVVTVLIGTAIVGLALTTVAESNDGLPIAAHLGFDRALVAALLGAGLVLGIAGDPRASACLAIVALAQLALSVSTRYSGA